MKIFQIHENLCFWDATEDFPTLESTVGRFPYDVVFVEAPDKVFVGWEYDESKTGDERFIQPTPPEGMYYNPYDGTFVTAPPTEPPPEMSESELKSKIVTLEDELAATKILLGVE